MKYCMKEETRVGGPWEFGTKPPGSGGDYKSLQIKDLKSFDEGRLQDLLDSQSTYQYNQTKKALQLLKLDQQKKKTPYDFPHAKH